MQYGKIFTKGEQYRKLFINKKFHNKLKNDFEKISSHWVYDKSKFDIAKKNVYISPPPMAIYWLKTVAYNRVLTDKELFNFYKEKGKHGYNDDFGLIARLYQFHAGYLRELHLWLCLMEMLPEAEIYKIINDDLKNDVDLYCEHNNKLTKVQVLRYGQSSKEHRLTRKDAKSSVDIVKLAAHEGTSTGLHLVSKKDIENFLVK